MKGNIFLKLILLVVGIGLIIGGKVTYDKFQKKMDTYVPTTSVVVGYDEKWDEDSITYAPIVSYFVEGKEYHAVYTSYSSFPADLGEELEIRYNRFNPTDVVFEQESSHIWMFVIGGLFVAVSIAMFFVKPKRREEEMY